MPACVVRWCVNRTEKHSQNTGISFRLFPRDPIQRELWTKAVRLERQEEFWFPSKHSRICSTHFKEKDFYKSPRGFTITKREAIPICTMVIPNDEEPKEDLTPSQKFKSDTFEGEKEDDAHSDKMLLTVNIKEEFNTEEMTWNHRSPIESEQKEIKMEAFEEYDHSIDIKDEFNKQEMTWIPQNPIENDRIANEIKIEKHTSANNTDESSDDEKPSPSALHIETEQTASKRKIKALQEKLTANKIILKRVRNSNCILKKKLRMSMALINKFKKSGLATKESINIERLKYMNKRLRERNATLKRLLSESKGKNSKDQRKIVWCDSNIKEEPDNDQKGIDTLMVKIEPVDDMSN